VNSLSQRVPSLKGVQGVMCYGHERLIQAMEAVVAHGYTSPLLCGIAMVDPTD
jgi:hypothetical protein